MARDGRAEEQEQGWPNGKQKRGGVNNYSYESPEGIVCTNLKQIREWMLRHGHPLFCYPVDGLRLENISKSECLPPGAVPTAERISSVLEEVQQRGEGGEGRSEDDEEEEGDEVGDGEEEGKGEGEEQEEEAEGNAVGPGETAATQRQGLTGKGMAEEQTSVGPADMGQGGQGSVPLADMGQGGHGGQGLQWAANMGFGRQGDHGGQWVQGAAHMGQGFCPVSTFWIRGSC